jgi:anhydro-N-acetylmuramic acid kinase
LNIGGIANVTWIGRDGSLIAFDTGPGNALIDDWMAARLGMAHDEGGASAAKGTPAADLITGYLMDPYFAAPPPKSLDRNAFDIGLASALSTEDGAATLTALTAATVAKSREHFPEAPALWVVCGGGRRNETLMSMIAERVANAVVPAEAVGLNGDGLEAEAWAYLAVRSALGLPITFPGTTGAEQPTTGGRLVRAPLSRSDG